MQPTETLEREDVDSKDPSSKDEFVIDTFDDDFEIVSIPEIVADVRRT